MSDLYLRDDVISLFKEYQPRLATHVSEFGDALTNKLPVYEEIRDFVDGKIFCNNLNEDFADCDQFVCSECGIELQDWSSVERDIDDGDVTYHEYTFKFCPNCGRKIIDTEGRYILHIDLKQN